jgi:hypothetical protein
MTKRMEVDLLNGRMFTWHGLDSMISAVESWGGVERFRIIYSNGEFRDLKKVEIQPPPIVCWTLDRHEKLPENNPTNPDESTRPVGTTDAPLESPDPRGSHEDASGPATSGERTDDAETPAWPKCKGCDGCYFAGDRACHCCGL